MQNKIIVKISEDDESVGYVYLPNELDEEKKKVKKTIDLSDVIDYKGVTIYLDFNEDGILLGIEIVG
ncbi:transcriptional regulator of nitric oxide reductase [Chryseobacterium bernardetii]|uniref:DUF2283 domain-containing protein n=2 Tax=Chryseobacterium TaxID=59732 RepID=A0A543EFL6_9FLAO|nr:MULTISPECIES: hypothetical protein [Chryseobacterium]MDR6370411.1 transcriptional regulator of nitric oxide reductase [Chryseobacterium vietnamense]MDR6441417.1 transcriptional regulator of nitric oxide reductase [Chryseobacterium bernardetii]TQM20371.1 hypothetical protein FB551_0033 [Chryseobacterium aquifrigidense]